MLVKCHGENHNALHDHGKTTLNLWEIYTATIRKKMGRIDSLLISGCQNFEFHHPYCSSY